MNKFLVVMCCAVIAFSCNQNAFVPKNKQRESSKTHLQCETIINNRHTFDICQGEPDSNINIFILRDKDTIYKNTEWTHGFEVKDFDEDGFKDIIFYYISNYAVEEIYLFDKTQNIFRMVEYSDSFPSAVKIKETNYYHCYNRRGCADSNWDSDLFYIKDYKIHKIGNIRGIGCPPVTDEEKALKNGIYITKIENDSIEKQIQFIPREAGYYNDKWDFIENYWTNNYKLFEI